MITTSQGRSTEHSSAPVQRHHNEGHGRRLTAAFEALEAFPALAESRNRLLRLVSAERVSPADVVATVESDIALVISVLRLANRLDGPRRGRVESIVKAVEILSPESVQALAMDALLGHAGVTMNLAGVAGVGVREHELSDVVQ